MNRYECLERGARYPLFVSVGLWIAIFFAVSASSIGSKPFVSSVLPFAVPVLALVILASSITILVSHFLSKRT